MPDTSALPYRQRRVYDFLIDYIARNGYPPTIGEIAENMGVRGSYTIRGSLGALERKGFIQRDRGISRGLRIVKD